MKHRRSPARRPVLRRNDSDALPEIDMQYANQAVQDLIEYVATEFSKDNTFDDARQYAEQTYEYNDPVRDQMHTLDDQWERLDDAEMRAAWPFLMLPLNQVAVPRLTTVAPENDAEEPWDLASLDAVRDAFDTFFRNHAGANTYELEWRTPEDDEDEDDKTIVFEKLGEDELFGYDGKYVDLSYWIDNDEDAWEELLRLQRFVDLGGEFKPDATVEEYFEQYGLTLHDVLDWVPETTSGGDMYISPYGMYGGSEGYWAIILDEGGLWSLFEESIGDDEWLADALGISPYDDEDLEAYRAMIYGNLEDDALEQIERKTKAEPEEERMLGFESSQGNFDFYDLQNAAAIKKQGTLMGQCVGNRQYGYIPAVEEGKAKIISMRTAAGKPKLTIEAYLDDKGNIVKFGEIKGKGNRIPGFSGPRPDGKFKPVEVEVVLAFMEEVLGPGWESIAHQNADLRPAIDRLGLVLGDDEISIDRQLQTRRNPKPVEAFSRGFQWGR